MTLLLLTNDDGIFAPGLAALAEALADLGEVCVVAPDRERSTIGHALTLHRPLRADRVGERRYAVNGTPSDCVNLGVLGLLPGPPSLVVAGINQGSNLGDDVTYSGTVAAAMEGILLGVPSIAVSLDEPDHGGFVEAGRIARSIAARVLAKGLPPKTLLNVNVPKGPVRGIRLTRLGHRVYKEQVVEKMDPRGRAYYWIGAGQPIWEDRDATDIVAIQQEHASITPLHLDLTNYEALRELASWDGDLMAELRSGRSRRVSPRGRG
ncbi:MAG: 5'/3'-nucleotidase SurE [Candidatus Methylomirabilia bacterium]